MSITDIARVHAATIGFAGAPVVFSIVDEQYDRFREIDLQMSAITYRLREMRLGDAAAFFHRHGHDALATLVVTIAMLRNAIDVLSVRAARRLGVRARAPVLSAAVDFTFTQWDAIFAYTVAQSAMGAVCAQVLPIDVATDILKGVCEPSGPPAGKPRCAQSALCRAYSCVLRRALATRVSAT
jgi:hypothetical protein